MYWLPGGSMTWQHPQMAPPTAKQQAVCGKVTRERGRRGAKGEKVVTGAVQVTLFAPAKAHWHQCWTCSPAELFPLSGGPHGCSPLLTEARHHRGPDPTQPAHDTAEACCCYPQANTTQPKHVLHVPHATHICNTYNTCLCAVHMVFGSS